MKKVFLLIALVAFLVSATAPSYASVIYGKGTTTIAQDKDKKDDTKSCKDKEAKGCCKDKEAKGCCKDKDKKDGSCKKDSTEKK